MRSRVGLALTVMALSGCSPCDYTLDAYSDSPAPVPKADTGYRGSGLSKEQYERDQQGYGGLAKEERDRLFNQKQAKGTWNTQPGAPAQPHPDPMPRFRKATTQECVKHYAGITFVPAAGLALAGWLLFKYWRRRKKQALIQETLAGNGEAEQAKKESDRYFR